MNPVSAQLPMSLVGRIFVEITHTDRMGQGICARINTIVYIPRRLHLAEA